MTTKARAILALIGTGVLLLLAGVVVWGAAIFAVGRSSEDLCLGDLVEHGYGVSQAQGELFPPRLTCVLRGPEADSDPRSMSVGHPIVATAWLTAVAGVPVVWLTGVPLVLWARQRRS